MMSTTDTLLALGRTWRQVDADGHVASVRPLEDLRAPARVLVDFSDSAMGVLRFEGRSRFAAAFIERHVREEGWVEGPAHVVVHRLVGRPGGAEAFFTAVDLEQWQAVMDWARRQRHHALVFPVGALLAAGRPSARVLRLDRRLVFLGQSPTALNFEDIYAAGDDSDQRLQAAGVIGTAIAGHASQCESVPRVEWLSAGDEEGDADRALVAEASRTAGLEIRRPDEGLRGQGSDAVPVSLLARTRDLPIRHALNSGAERAAFMAERWSGLAAAVVAALAIGLAVVGYQAHSMAEEEAGRADRLIAENRTLNDKIQRDRPQIRQDELDAFLELAGRIHTGSDYKPARVLEDLRRAAPESLAIHRVRLESGRQGYRLRVDGMDRSSSNGSAIRPFVRRLQEAGWDTTSLEPAASGRGAFSYRLEAGGGSLP